MTDALCNLHSGVVRAVSMSDSGNSEVADEGEPPVPPTLLITSPVRYDTVTAAEFDLQDSNAMPAKEEEEKIVRQGKGGLLGQKVAFAQSATSDDFLLRGSGHSSLSSTDNAASPGANILPGTVNHNSLKSHNKTTAGRSSFAVDWGLLSLSSSRQISNAARLQALDRARETSNRQQILSRTSMGDDSAKNHIRILTKIQALTILCCLPVLAFCQLKNAVPCSSEWVGKSIPDFTFMIFFEYGLFFSITTVSIVCGLVNCFFPPDMALSRWQIVALFLSYFLIIVGGKLMIVRSNKSNPSLSDTNTLDSRMKIPRIAAAFALVLSQSLFMYLNGRRNTQLLNLSVMRERDWRLVKNCISFGVVFFLGFYGCLVFATQAFPALKERVSSSLGDSSSALATIAQGACELLLATSFFSLFLPLWSRKVSAIATNIFNDYFPDGTSNEISAERGHIVVNFLLDCTRFVYGRGVLFSISNISLFFALVLKDVASQFWHFGFK